MTLADKDLLSVQQARTLAAKAREAARTVAGFSQEQIDAIVAAMSEAARPEAERLAKLAHEETGFGNVADKTRKNTFAAVDVHEFVKPMRTVGVLREIPARRIVEMADPMGVVAAIIPSTNPTSTAIYKALISVKAGNACVLSPHPSAKKCILEAWSVLHGAAVKAGLPADALACMSEVTLEGTQELMKCRDTAVILATGGIGLVRAAYSSGKPAYGVGPGNVPVYVDKSADVARAVAMVVAGKTFDWGTLCSSEQAIVCHQDIAEQALVELKKNNAYVMDDREAEAVARVAVTAQRLANPAVVGRPATTIAEKAGITVPKETGVLVAKLTGVGRDFPLSIEKLAPILAFYSVRDWQEGSERCLQLLRFGGTGHTMGIHSGDEALTRRFAVGKPVSRVVVNTQTSMGATGYTTGLAPSMSLGCGAYAGNITTDNITPLHLLNVKRVAFELPRDQRAQAFAAAPVTPATLAAFVQERVGSPAPATAATAPTVDFVSEDDVRRALREGRKLRLAARSIVTPAARDLASGTDVLQSA